MKKKSFRTLQEKNFAIFHIHNSCWITPWRKSNYIQTNEIAILFTTKNYATTLKILFTTSSLKVHINELQPARILSWYNLKMEKISKKNSNFFEYKLRRWKWSNFQFYRLSFFFCILYFYFEVWIATNVLKSSNNRVNLFLHIEQLRFNFRRNHHWVRLNYNENKNHGGIQKLVTLIFLNSMNIQKFFLLIKQKIIAQDFS